MNIPLLKRVKAAILKHPDQFEMSWWFQDDIYLMAIGRFGETRRAGGCGTAACIGGWVCHLASSRKRVEQTKVAIQLPGRRAARLLGIDGDQSNRLFIIDSWPDAFCRRYKDATTPETRARAAARRIDHFIKTKGAE